MMVIGVFDCDYETSVGLLMEIVYLRIVIFAYV